MKSPSHRQLLWFSIVLVLCCILIGWIWNNRLAQPLQELPSHIPPAVAQPPGAEPGSALPARPLEVANASVEQELNGGQLTAEQRDAAQRKVFVSQILARLNPLLAERSAGRQEEFEQIKQDFVSEYAVDFQDLTVMKTPFEFREVPIRMNPATRQFPGAGRGPIVPTMLTLVPRFN